MKIAVAALAVLLAGSFAAAAQARDLRASGPVTALGTTGVEVAYAARYSARCTEIRVWHTADRGVRRYASHCFAATSTGSGVAAVAVSNGRALWLTYTGGNLREWSLWTKTRTSAAKRIRLVTRDVDAAAPIVVGSAWEGSLPYAADRTIVVLQPNGARRFAVDAPAPVVALNAHERGYAAVLSNGSVFTLSPTGAPLREYEYPRGQVQAAVVTGAGVLVATRSGLDVHSGRAVQRHPLPAGYRFAGFSQNLLAYGTSRALRLRRLTTEADVAYVDAAPAHAQLGRLGLGRARGSVVSFNARAVLHAAAR